MAVRTTLHQELVDPGLHDNHVYPVTGTPLPSWGPLDGRFPLRGEMLSVPADPTSALQVATKQYVDNLTSLRQFKTTYTAAVAGADFIITPATAGTGLQTALNTINTAGGGVLEIRVDTTWTINARVSLPSNITIRQVGLGRLKKATNLNSFIFKNSDHPNGNTNIALIDLRLDGNYQNQASIPHICDFQKLSRSYFSGIDIINSGSQIFRLRYSDYNTFENCQAEQAKAEASVFYFEYGSSYNVVIGNRSKGFTVALNIDSIQGVCSYNVIVNNLFEDDNAPTYLNGDCILLVHGTCYTTVIGNVVKKYAEDGIRISNDSNHNSIVGNIITDTGRYGIAFTDNHHNIASGNTITNTGANGIFVDEEAHDITIQGNSIDGVTTLDGIILNPGTYDCLVTGNIVTGAARYGIYVNQSTANSVVENRVDGLGVSGNGIYLLNAKDTIINANLSRNHTGSGIRLEELTVDGCVDNIVTSNRCYGNLFGIQEVSSTQTPDYNVFGGNILRGNTTALVLSGTNSRIGSTTVGDTDVEITDFTKGVVLKSLDGTRYRVTVANGGTLSVMAA